MNQRLAEPVLSTLGYSLLDEVEGRLFHTLARGYQTRHGGVLRNPADLNLYAEYTRPEIVRFFGVHYHPAKHNQGLHWFEDEAAVFLNLDTFNAVAQQHRTRFLSARRFSWTSQNQMKPTNRAGSKVLNADSEKRTLRLFIQPRSHKPALYVGRVVVAIDHHTMKHSHLIRSTCDTTQVACTTPIQPATSTAPSASKQVTRTPL